MPTLLTVFRPVVGPVYGSRMVANQIRADRERTFELREVHEKLKWIDWSILEEVMGSNPCLKSSWKLRLFLFFYLFIYLFYLIHHKVYIKHNKSKTYSCLTSGEHKSATEFKKNVYATYNYKT
jgi:hypothetical protein